MWEISGEVYWIKRKKNALQYLIQNLPENE